MNTKNRLIDICERFEKKEFDIVELQSRLETMMIDDENARFVEELIHESSNRLEEIRFCSLESNFYKHGLEVTEKIKDAVEHM